MIALALTLTLTLTLFLVDKMIEISNLELMNDLAKIHDYVESVEQVFISQLAWYGRQIYTFYQPEAT